VPRGCGAREGVSLNVIQRQLGHANLGTTSIYLQGIDTEGDHRDPCTPGERR
jgi:integrase